jgi:3-oxoacyl-[acyl-carrier-protein] synthase III
VSKILGMGYCLPDRQVDNADLARTLRATGDVEKQIFACGVRTRHYADDGIGPSDLAKSAAQIALRSAGIGEQDVELLIFATMTPDVTFPGAGCYLQHKLGCRTVGALDVRAQCAGFLFALEIADSFLSAGAYRRVLVAAGDVHSSGLDFSPRAATVTPLFGDGAVAVVLDSEGDALVASAIHTDATEFERFWCEFPSSRRRPVRALPEDLSLGTHYPKIDAEFVRRDGRERMLSAVEEVFAKSGTKPRDVRRYFFQHVFRDTALGVAETLGVSDSATVGGLDEGHIASASLPLALCRARERGEVGPDDLVCLATAGAGSSWGAALVRL